MAMRLRNRFRECHGLGVMALRGHGAFKPIRRSRVSPLVLTSAAKMGKPRHFKSLASGWPH